MALLGARSHQSIPFTVKMTPCQEYDGLRSREGYGRVQLGGAQVWAHRLAYAMGHGIDPAGKVVRHICNNPPCVNPDHLVLGTNAENMADKILSGVVRGENNPAAKLGEQDARGARCLLALGVRKSTIAAILGVTKQMVRRIERRLAWSHV